LQWGIAAFAAMVVVVGAFLAFGPLGDPPAEVETEPPVVEVEPPRWTAVAQTVENRSGGDVVARRAPRLDAAELEVLGPGAIRPAIGVTGSVMTADIDGVTWLNYPTPIADVRGYVPEADISAPD
jgi:hypothetical protein